MTTPRTAEPADAPVVSIVMPVWNPRADWLRQAVAGALAERAVPVELVLVDDGCAEPVADLLAPVEDGRVRVLRVQHGGEAHARNAGVAAARGRYVRYADADDVLAAGSTGRLLRLTGDGTAIAYGATAFCDEHLRPRWTMTSRARGWVARECLLGRFTVRPPSMLFPRWVVDAAGEWEPFAVSLDWDFVLRALDHAPVRGERRIASYYRKHGGGMTADHAAGEQGARRVVEKYFERHPELRGTRVEREAEAALLAIAARVRATRKRPLEAARLLARALVLDPRAVAHELAQALPAAGGMLRTAVTRPRPPREALLLE